MKSLLARMLLKMAPLPIVIWLLILLPAGTRDFWQVYVYFGLVMVVALGGIFYFLKHDPELLERRLKTKEKESEQKIIMAIMGISVLAIYMIPGFDKRFGWSDIPTWLVLIGDALAVCGYLSMLYVSKVNSFAGRTIEVVQNQQLIDTGPYAHVRHPMYAGGMLMYLGTPLALGSWWAFAAVAIVPVCLAARILNEEKVLKQALEGYTEYCSKLRWRLIPGIW